MAVIISSEARWLTPARLDQGTTTCADQGATAPAGAPHRPVGPVSAADHRLRRRLGRKCASVLAGASLSLGLAAARIPTASAQSGPAQAQAQAQSHQGQAQGQGQAAYSDRPVQ